MRLRIDKVTAKDLALDASICCVVTHTLSSRSLRAPPEKPEEMTKAILDAAETVDDHTLMSTARLAGPGDRARFKACNPSWSDLGTVRHDLMIEPTLPSPTQPESLL